MTTHPTSVPPNRARPPSAAVGGADPLLFIPLAGALGVVAAVLLLASAPGTLTLIFAIFVALAGMASVIAAANSMLGDADGEAR